ncbi:hypothetical protein ABMA27_003526 [Loxostege sticticalis]|uniref:tRNA:m(4)X modification enzyme TRM13 n=1 Tax=Loxostege sticticalis TaxID=481309 RepID=A0ABR3HTE4_LOXSC
MMHEITRSTCYISKLQKHLSICNARQGELPPYIVKDVNTAVGPEEGPRPLLSEVPRETMEQLIEKVNMLYDKHIKDNITTVAEEPIHPIVLEDYTQSDRAESSRRHLRQASSLLRLAEREGLVQDRSCYVELGAGKGHMSYYAWRAWCEPTTRGSSVLLVDRASLRHKRDNKLRDTAYTTARNQTQDTNNDRVSPAPDRQDNSNGTETNGSNTESKNGISHAFNPTADSSQTANSGDYTNANMDADASNMAAPIRLRADLADLALDKVPVVQECDRVVGFAKHLCGVATDFALRCIMSEGLGSKAQGVVIATCCHHRCQTNTYVGFRHLKEMGISAADMGVLYGVVSWATCGDGRPRARRQQDAQNGLQTELGQGDTTDEAQGYKLPLEVREATGRKAKALLDWGRVLRLRDAGFRARLCRYVPVEASPENVAIVASKIHA